MPQNRVLPDASELRELRRRGMTHREIRDLTEERTGRKVGLTAVSMAFARLGEDPATPRYDDLLPWKVKVEHITAYPARMLRLEGRRRAGGKLSDLDLKRLTSWRAKLAEANAVVLYHPGLPEGFVYVPRRPGIDGDLISNPQVPLNG